MLIPPPLSFTLHLKPLLLPNIYLRMDITLIDEAGTSLVYEVDPSATLQRFSEEVAKLFGKDAGSIRLMYDGAELEFVEQLEAGSEVCVEVSYLAYQELLRKKGSRFDQMPKHVRSDHATALVALQMDLHCLPKVGISLQTDHRFLVDAVRVSVYVIRSNAMAKSADLLVACIEANPSCLRICPWGILTDPIMKRVLALRSDMLTWLPSAMMRHKYVQMAVELDGLSLRYAKQEYQDDADIVDAAIEQNPMALRYAGRVLRSSLSRLVMKKCPGFLQFAGHDLRDDRDIVKEAVTSDSSLFKFCSKRLKQNTEFVIEMMQIDASLFKQASASVRSDPHVVELALKAQEAKPGMLRFACPVCGASRSRTGCYFNSEESLAIHMKDAHSK